MKTITKMIEVTPYVVICEFNNGEIRRINLQPIIEKYSITSPDLYGKLQDIDYFKQVYLESYGTLTWPNEMELDPDNLFMISEPIEPYGI